MSYIVYSPPPPFPTPCSISENVHTTAWSSFSFSW